MVSPPGPPADEHTSLRVVVGTALEQDPGLRGEWEEQLRAAQLDPAVFGGAFGTNVWAGRYEVDRLIGHGGQGATFAATDRKTGARVAIKVLDLRHAKDWKRLELFEREVEVLRSVQHERMPALLDVLDDPATGARALVMSLIPGEDLGTVLRREGPLAEAALWRVLVDVLGVLAALHSQDTPVVHRDIKPQNLVRGGDGRVSVVDFGGVGWRREGGSTVVGTFGYMAPELLYGDSSPATDLYGLGASLLSLATGREPEEMPRRGLALDVDAAAPGLSAPLRALLSRMVAPEPSGRPVDARTLLAELDRFVVEVATGTTKTSPTQHGDIEHVVETVAAVLRVVVGVLGATAAVLLGEILLPVLFALIGAFAKRESRDRLERVRETVASLSAVGRKSFTATAQQGVAELQRRPRRGRRRVVRSTRPSGKGRRGG